MNLGLAFDAFARFQCDAPHRSVSRRQRRGLGGPGGGSTCHSPRLAATDQHRHSVRARHLSREGGGGEREASQCAVSALARAARQPSLVHRQKRVYLRLAEVRSGSETHKSLPQPPPVHATGPAKH